MGFMASLFDNFETPKSAVIKDRKLGFIYQTLRVFVLVYFVCDLTGVFGTAGSAGTMYVTTS